MMKKRDMIILLGTALILCISAMVYLLKGSNFDPENLRYKPAVSFSTSLNIGGNFTLIDQNGKPLSTETFADKYKLVFFGFTSCPAICPTELQKISSAMDSLGAISKYVQPIFISVDPERDTPAVLKEYLALFPNNIVGFTGTQAQIDAVKKQYRVYSAKVKDPAATDYTIDHSTYIYFLGKDSKVLDLFNTQDTADNIAARVRLKLQGI